MAGDADDDASSNGCQATRVPYFAKDLNAFDRRHYVQDLTSGNVGFGAWLYGVVYITYGNGINFGIGVASPLRWLCDRFQSVIGGVPYHAS